MSKMISHGRDTESAAKHAKLALVTGIIWLALVAGFWVILRNDPGEGGGFLNFLGRWHVLVVHLPIGLLMVVGLLEALNRGKKAESMREPLIFMLWVSFLGAAAAALLGYFLMQKEGEAGKAMPLHMWTGFAVVVFALIALVAKLSRKSGAYYLSLILAIGSVGAAGHFGGTLVHGKEYLTEYAPGPLKTVLEPVLFAGLGAPTAPETEGEGESKTEIALENQVVYTKFVAPILAAKCTECHDENKIKGKLRMDTHELLMAGAEGSEYPTVKPGDPENSEMIVRVLLDPAEDDFMPPGENEPLTAEEIKVLSWWIKSGASADKTVADLAPEDEILGALAVMDATRKGAEVEKIVWVPEWDTLTDEERATRIADAQEAATKYNFSLMPISAEDERLRVNVINASKEFGDEQLKTLEPIAEHILWLDVARSQVTDEGMKSINKMRNLERLHLEETKITDKGISQIEPLKSLAYLNLYGTEVTDAVFENLKGMGNLQKLFVWQTRIDPATARAFERSVNLEINTGVDLAAVAAEKAAEEKAAADKAAAEKAAADKAAADKKAADAKAAAEKVAAAKKAAEKAAADKAAAVKAAADKAAADKKAADAKAAAAAKKPAPAPAPAPAANKPAPKAEAPKAEAPKAAAPNPAPKAN